MQIIYFLLIFIIFSCSKPAATTTQSPVLNVTITPNTASNSNASSTTASSTNASSTATSSTTASSTIYLDSNNVTIKCPNADIGYKDTINQKEYTVVDIAKLRDMIGKDEDVSCVCTSQVLSMNLLFNQKKSFNQKVF